MTVNHAAGLLGLAPPRRPALRLVAAPAEAHPHVWITAKSEVVYAPDGSITGVRHAWTFDDMFTTYALQGLATKTKGVYTREELAPLAQTNVESLKEFNFFTFAKADGKKDEIRGAGGLLPRIQGQRADAAFRPAAEGAGDGEADSRWKCSIPPTSSTSSSTTRIRSSSVGAPAACQMQFQRPNDDTANAQRLNEQNFMNGDNSNYGAMFANKIMVNCP